MTPSARILVGDCLRVLRTLPSGSVRTCVTSPPYWGLRDYGHAGQLGMEATPDLYAASMVEVFREVRRVLSDDGTLWLNLGDSYAAERGGTHPPAETLAGGIGGKTDDGERVNRGRLDGFNPSRNAKGIGLKHKDLVGIPWRVAFALQADGWYLRQDIIWHKPNPMPESVRDRCTKAHEYVFLLSKSERYFFDADAMQEPALGAGGPKTEGRGTGNWGVKPIGLPGERANHGRSSGVANGRETRNRRSVWTVTTRPFKGAHFATYPAELIEPCIAAGSAAGDVVLDPFNGAGTTGIVALRQGRSYVGIEINPEYAAMSEARLQADLGFLATVSLERGG